MPARSWLLIIVALAVAAFTAFAVKSRLHQAETPAAAVVSQTKVLVANGDIAPGSFIRPETELNFVVWPAETIQPSYITEAGHTVQEFSGAVARRAIAKGEPITPTMIVKTSEGGFMSAVLSPGSRAVSIAVNETSGNAGFVFPGDRVDLIVTHSVPVATTEGQAQQNIVVSETFVEDVRVLAIDQMLDNPENKAVLAKTVTLEVTPKQAEMVNVAADLGKIALSLRSLATHAKETVATPEALPTNPWGEAEPELTQPNATSDREVSKTLENSGALGAGVNVIRGNEMQKMQFNRSR